MTNKKTLTQNTLNAIDAVRASGAIVPESTIDLMVQMDNGQLTEDEAIKKIIEEEGLMKIKKSQ